MFNNFISGGQVFLHKIRMFKQVMLSSVLVSLLAGTLIACYIKLPGLLVHDWRAALTYVKADTALGINSLSAGFRASNKKEAKINAYYKHGLYKRNIPAVSITQNSYFKTEYNKIVVNLKYTFLLLAATSSCLLILVFAAWNKFGKLVQGDKNVDGGKVLTTNEVSSYLHRNKQASSIRVGGMPLVKGSETQHILITGATGSGKTNLIHNILPQIAQNNQPALVIDQTGEMIAKYYNKARGDIIFNPFDKRSSIWDFWTDCCTTNQGSFQGGVYSMNDKLEKFAKILFGFNSNKQSPMSSDPFWQESAEVIFTSCVETLLKNNNKSLYELQHMLRNHSLPELQKTLAATPAARYLVGTNKNTASSILSVLATSTKPLQYLMEPTEGNNSFSLVEYFQKINNNTSDSNAWLFLATKPSQRELTLPLIACIVELAASCLIDINIDKTRRVWFIIDELSALGRLPALSWLMSESRKYGGCVIAGMQSINQLFRAYGHYLGSTIFGQFASKFFFRTDEPEIAKIITQMCGSSNIAKQQKNISFGANELRDGISYTQQEKQKMLVEFKDLASLKIGECFCLLPEPAVRLAKLQLSFANLPDQNLGFVPHTRTSAPNIGKPAAPSTVLASSLLPLIEHDQHGNEAEHDQAAALELDQTDEISIEKPF